MENNEQQEICLVDRVAAELKKVGLTDLVEKNYFTHALIKDAKSFVDPEAQRHLLNRFWMTQLLACPIVASTVDERYCLIPNGSIEDWLRIFKQKIIPFCMEHQLPAAY